MKLQLGCGHITFAGWTNIDMIPAVNTGHEYICHDLRSGLPGTIPNDSVDFIYHEHFLEHLTREEGLVLLSSCYRKLKPGGVMRLTVPDLEYLVHRYNTNNIDWGGPGGWQPKNRCIMINQGFHAWGHQFLYDKGEIMDVLQESGFSDMKFVDCRKSEHSELHGIDCRLEPSDLRVEATKIGS